MFSHSRAHPLANTPAAFPAHGCDNCAARAAQGPHDTRADEGGKRALLATLHRVLCLLCHCASAATPSCTAHSSQLTEPSQLTDSPTLLGSFPPTSLAQCTHKHTQGRPRQSTHTAVHMLTQERTCERRCAETTPLTCLVSGSQPSLYMWTCTEPALARGPWPLLYAKYACASSRQGQRELDLPSRAHHRGTPPRTCAGQCLPVANVLNWCLVGRYLCLVGARVLEMVAAATSCYL